MALYRPGALAFFARSSGLIGIPYASANILVTARLGDIRFVAIP